MEDKSMVKTEIELISKKVWRKKKKEMFRLRSWLLLHVLRNVKTVVEDYLSSENVYTYILMVDNLMMK